MPVLPTSPRRAIWCWSKRSRAIPHATPADSKQHATPQLVGPTASLLLTAVLWGTNPICLRFLDRAADPPPAALLTAVQSCAAAAWLSLLGLATQKQGPAEQKDDSSTASAASGSRLQALLPAVELGVWTFAANAATVVGFETASASRGAFLIRLTAVFTPVVAAVLGQASPPSVWAGSAVALAGGLLISLGGTASQAATSSGIQPGDMVMAGAAFLWACQTVRLGRLVAGRPPLQLAAQQMGVTGLLCTLWALSDAASAHKGNVNYSLDEWRDPVRVLAVLWPAAGPWGLGSFLQMRAQREVSAARTQIILASDPVWATLFAGLLLGSDEQNLGALGWLGAACIFAASVLSRE